MERAPRNEATGRRGQGSCAGVVATTVYLLLATGLLLTAGCATMQTAKVAPVEAKPVVAAEPPPPAGPGVEHFTGGRKGFVISEPSGMAGQASADFDRAGAMIKEARYDQAIELLEKVIARSPDLTAPHINIAIVYVRVNKPELAEQHLKKALELIPAHPLASNEYGLLLRKAGRFAESRLIYEKSLSVFPEYSPLHRNLGILCDLYLKESACALEHYEVYAKAMPKDQQVKLWLVDLQTRTGHIASLAGSGRTE
jgi:tetratricopeptide (TPR) repeat protein